LAEGPTFIYNAPRAQHRFSPASTFKILNSLIALEERAIAGEERRPGPRSSLRLPGAPHPSAAQPICRTRRHRRARGRAALGCGAPSVQPVRYASSYGCDAPGVSRMCQALCAASAGGGRNDDPEEIQLSHQGAKLAKIFP